MSHFFIVDNPEGTKRIECMFVVYKEKFDTLLYEIEEDDNRWKDFPFKDNVLSYWK